MKTESEMGETVEVNGVSHETVVEPAPGPKKKRASKTVTDMKANEKKAKALASSFKKGAKLAKSLSAAPKKKASAASASKSKPARASSKQASAAKKKPGKRGPKAHTRASKLMASQGRYVLVIHMELGMQRVLDKKIKGTDHSRSSWARQAVAKALGYRETDVRQPKKLTAKSAKPAKKKAAARKPAKKKLASSV
jgi:hypothetical protein